MSRTSRPKSVITITTFIAGLGGWALSLINLENISNYITNNLADVAFWVGTILVIALVCLHLCFRYRKQIKENRVVCLIKWSVLYAIVNVITLMAFEFIQISVVSYFTHLTYAHAHGLAGIRSDVHTANVVQIITLLSANESALICGYLCAKKVHYFKLWAGVLPVIYWVPSILYTPLQGVGTHLPEVAVFAARVLVFASGLLGAFIQASRSVARLN